MNNLVIVSGYFNPIHVGHIHMLKEAKEIATEDGQVCVIINNDSQQLLKKNKIIMTQDERREIVKAIRYVNHTIISIDKDKTVRQTLDALGMLHQGTFEKIIFCNGGDRQSIKDIPETKVCEVRGIEMRFGVGGNNKANSSTNINKLRGEE